MKKQSFFRSTVAAVMVAGILVSYPLLSTLSVKPLEFWLQKALHRMSK